jgi:hypothetical protein
LSLDSPLAKVVCACQAGRTGSDNGDFVFFPGFDFWLIARLFVQIQICQKTLNGVGSYGFIDLGPVAIRFTGVMTDPSADRWEGIFLLDELQGFLKFPLGRKADISLDIDVAGQPIGKGGFLFLNSDCGTALHRFLTVIKDDACLRIMVMAPSGAGLGTDGHPLPQMLTPHEIKLPVHEFRAIPPNREVLDRIVCIDWIVFLFAGHFTGLTSPAGELFDNQCMLIHG